MTSRRIPANPTHRDLIKIATRAGCPMRNSSGHLIVQLPTGRNVIFRQPGRPRTSQRPTDQIKLFREAGLL